MTSIIKRTQRDYSLAFKLAVVDQVEKGELTYKQAQDKYGIYRVSLVTQAWQTGLVPRNTVYINARTVDD
ncbi:hypothetical protein DIKCMJMK_04347 [Shewanella oneidensis]|nr:hypothetical protein [Shewanella oneidensis]